MTFNSVTTRKPSTRIAPCVAAVTFSGCGGEDWRRRRPAGQLSGTQDSQPENDVGSGTVVHRMGQALMSGFERSRRSGNGGKSDRGQAPNPPARVSVRPSRGVFEPCVFKLGKLRLASLSAAVFPVAG